MTMNPALRPTRGSTLATLNTQTLASVEPPSSMWQQLVRKLPELSNATRYYAHDVQKFGMGVLASAASATVAPTVALDPIVEGRNEGDPSGLEEGEVHYQPNPTHPIALAVHRVAVEAQKWGTTTLTLCIEGGFSIFEVASTGIYEIIVDAAIAGAPVVDAKLVDPRTVLLATRKALLQYDIPSRRCAGGRELSEVPTSLHLMRSHVVICSADYSLLTLLKLPSLEELCTIVADRPIVATSASWLAYSGNAEAPTNFSAKKSESTVEVVAKGVASGISAIKQGIWGGCTGLHSASSPLGTIVIFDVDLNQAVASFSAHNHPLQFAQFDRTGTLLATASTAGTTINVFQVSCSEAREETHGMVADVTLLYRLTRGMTSCVVTDIQFGPLAAWIAVCTSVGTCHFYHLKRTQRSVFGKGALQSHAAPAVGAICRARSAPCLAPVNPMVGFSPQVQLSAGRATHVDAIIACPTGMVSFFVVGEAGATLLYTKYLDGFSGARVQHLSPVAACPIDDADSEWRAFLELVSHPELPPLQGFRLATADGLVQDLAAGNAFAGTSGRDISAAMTSAHAARASALQENPLIPTSLIRAAPHGSGDGWEKVE